jgi:hypothetical protein
MKPETYALLAICGLVFAFVAIDRVALWMERRGWVYWRKRKAGGGGGAAAGLLTGFQQIIEPRVEHRIQVMEERNESVGHRLGRGDGVDADPATPTKAPAMTAAAAAPPAAETTLEQTPPK